VGQGVVVDQNNLLDNVQIRNGHVDDGKRSEPEGHHEVQAGIDADRDGVGWERGQGIGKSGGLANLGIDQGAGRGGRGDDTAAVGIERVHDGRADIVARCNHEVT
jgi:hypothetical protein